MVARGGLATTSGSSVGHAMAPQRVNRCKWLKDSVFILRVMRPGRRNEVIRAGIGENLRTVETIPAYPLAAFFLTRPSPVCIMNGTWGAARNSSNSTHLT